VKNIWRKEVELQIYHIDTTIVNGFPKVRLGNSSFIDRGMNLEMISTVSTKTHIFAFFESFVLGNIDVCIQIIPQSPINEVFNDGGTASLVKV
jgi:hypothetical protein